MKSGFTLLEMLLVLAILVAITAVTLPTVERMYDTHHIQQAAMEVRTALSAARLRAVDRGETWECRFVPEGRQLVVVASQEQGIRFGDDPDRTLNRRQQSRAAAAIHVELPEPLAFWTAHATRERLGADLLRELTEQHTSLGNHAWSAPILFAPNGSSTNAHFEIRDRQGRAVQLDVRGLTGAASSTTRVKRGGP